MNEKDQPTPEQLLKLLDSQMEASRRARETRKDSGKSLPLLSIGIIVGIACVALWVLMMVLEEMRPPKSAAPVPTETR
jgi:hypothetical protein